MSQPIQSYGQNPYAEEALRLAEIGKGQQGMARTAAPVGTNLALGGPMAQPMLNSQPYSNARLEQQNQVQNFSTSIPQAQASALNKVTVDRAVESDVAKKTHDLVTRTKSEIMLANEAGQATAAMADPAFADDVRTKAAVQSLLAKGVNPQKPYTSNNFAA